MRERALNTDETEQSVGRQTQKAQTCHGRSCRSRCCCCRRCRKSRQQQFWPARPRELRCSCTLSAEGHKRLRSRHPGWQLGGAAPATGHGTRCGAGGPSSGTEPPSPPTSSLGFKQLKLKLLRPKNKRPLPPKVKNFISSSFFKGSLADYHLNLAINARYI